MGAIRIRFNTGRRWRQTPLALALVVALAGCGNDVYQHGHLPDPEKIAEVKPGTTTKSDIIKLLGSPSSVSTFDDKTWYYISRRTEQIAFFEPKVLDQQVFIVNFDDSGVVRDLDHRSLTDARSIPMAPGATPAPGREMSFLEQLLGNVGRFGGSGN
jgi:outer membrane protein assembly factor BamE (lipoprotein component of BamABCDE complex)